MCGIFGAFGSSSFEYGSPVVRESLLHALQNLSLRGRDGFGISSYNGDDELWNLKALVSIRGFSSDDLSNLLEEKPRVILASARAVPTSEFEQGAGQSQINQQPFYSQKWTVVHNGLLHNDRELVKQHSIKVSSNVDSAILPELFEKFGFAESIRMLEGSYAIIAYNRQERVLYFANSFLPLWYVRSTDFSEVDRFYIASLKEMLPLYVRENAKKVPTRCIGSFSLQTGLNFSPINVVGSDRVLVIASSGIDSTVTAYLYRKLGFKVSLLHFTYGQAAEKCELFSIRKIAKNLGAELIIYDARRIFEPFKRISRLLSKKQGDKKTRMHDQESTFSYVPNRNMLFATIAGGIAEMKEIHLVAFGAQMDDAVYPDNNIGFTESIDETFKYSLNQKTVVNFRSPLVHLIKHEVLELGLKLGVPFEYVTSCYYPKLIKGKIVNCGKCGCDAYRMNAFKMMKVRDPQKTMGLDGSYWEGCEVWGNVRSRIDHLRDFKEYLVL